MLTHQVAWKWYQYGWNKDYECWEVTNKATKHSIKVNSELACLKIIIMAHALKTGEPKPLNHASLERKVKFLEGVKMGTEKFWNWDGKKLTYDTSAYNRP